MPQCIIFREFFCYTTVTCQLKCSPLVHTLRGVQRIGKLAFFLQATKALRESRGTALLFSRTSALDGVVGQPHAPAASTPGKDPVPILQEAEWTPGPVWMGGKPRPFRDLIPGRPARIRQLYRLSYRAHVQRITLPKINIQSNKI